MFIYLFICWLICFNTHLFTFVYIICVNNPCLNFIVNLCLKNKYKKTKHSRRMGIEKNLEFVYLTAHLPHFLKHIFFGHVVKDHFDNGSGNPLPLFHWLLF